MFTSIDVDDSLYALAAACSRKKTKKGVIEDALRAYVRLHEQAGVRQLRGQLVWEGDLDSLRGLRRDGGADPR